MTWPLASDFNTILQNPKLAFREAGLKQIDIEKTDQGQPKPRSGAFANVYKGRYPNGNGDVAIRVFTSGNPERRERYQAISEYLQPRKLDSLVGFTYADNGIRSAGDGKWYPLVTMEWVRGEQLFDWVQTRCGNKDRGAMAKVSQLWLSTVQELTRAHIAHGDLQHGNIMITDDGQLKLVDYDCMCVPSLVGRKNLEIGVEPYQHPERNQDTLLAANLDNFSALFIFVALRALAASPDLWAEYVAKPQYDKLLFRREDFAEPMTSSLIQSLRRSPDAEVQRLTNELLELTRVHIDQVPRLEDVLFSFANVEALLNQRDFDAAIDLLARGKKQVSEAPPALQPRLQDAQKRIQQRQELEKAVNAGDETTMDRCYASKLLSDYPKAKPLVEFAQLAPKVIPILQRLQTTSQAQKWRDFVREWDSNQTLLTPRKSAERYVPLVQTWRQRNQACDALLEQLRPTHPNGAAVSVAWEILQRLGGHPDSDAHRQRVDQLVKRERSWQTFVAAPRTSEESADQYLLTVWSESLFAGWDQAERQRQEVTQSRERLDWLGKLKQVASQPLVLASEVQIVQIGKAFPQDYQYTLRPRVELARQRIGVIQQLKAAFEAPCSDVKIAKAWRQLAELQGQPLVGADLTPRITLAQKRDDALKPLQQIPANYAPQQAAQWDAKLLAAWRAELFDECHDAQPWQPAYALAVRRKQVLDEFRTAIARSDKLKIADLIAEPCLAGYPLSTEWVRIAKAAAVEVGVVRELIKVLSQGERGRLLSVFDAGVVRGNSATFAAHQQNLLAWLPSEVLPAQKLLLNPPTAHKSLQLGGASSAKCVLRWNWPEPRFCDDCLVAVCRNRPRPTDEPTTVPAHIRATVTRKSYEEGGGSRTLHTEHDWSGAYVIVWARVNLGFQVLWSEPLVLGKL